MIRRHLAVVVTALAFSATVTGSDAATAAHRLTTPTPVTLMPQTVDPASCQIAPLPLWPTLAIVAAIYRDGRTVPEAPEVLSVDTETDTRVTIDGDPWVLDGRLVGEAGIEPSLEPLLPALLRTLHEDAACGNAGDAARFFALRTADEFARTVERFDEEEISLDEWRTYLTSATGPIGEGYVRIGPVVVAAKRISDGRVAVYGVLTQSVGDFRSIGGPTSAEPRVWILERVGERWLFDWQIESMEKIPVRSGEAATPNTLDAHCGGKCSRSLAITIMAVPSDC